jgi:small-conductance mechanosensitive channel/CRP-like cAMP-binding protein
VPWLTVGLTIGILISAFLVNRFAPKKRRRIRRLLILLGLYLVAFGAHLLLSALDQDVWAGRTSVLMQFIEAFLGIQLCSLVLFSILMRVIHLEPPAIVVDLMVGAATLVAIFIILREQGVDMGHVLAGGALVSAVLAVSLQSTLGNVIGGVALQIDGSIHVGDWIMLENGKQGRVTEIGWRHTVLETRDWDVLVVPNSQLLSASYTVLGRREGASSPHRMWVYFHVDFRYAPATVIRVVEEALRGSSIERVADKPAPNCVCMDFARDGRDSFALYAVRYWLTDIAVDDPTSSAVRARIWAALERAHIPLARPARTIFMLDDAAYQKEREHRHAREREAALRAVSLFDALNADEIKHISDRMIEVPFSAGECMTHQGAVAHWLYLLAAGDAEVRIVGGEATRVVARIKAPDYFGEMGLMTGEPRHADVVALTDTTCYRLEKAVFEEVLKHRPEIAKALSQVLASRLVVLVSARENLNEAEKEARRASEQGRILEKIQTFFGLS